MEAPKCKLCGVRHWGKEHVYAKAVTTLLRDSNDSVTVEARSNAPVTLGPDAPVISNAPVTPTNNYIPTEQEMILAAVDPQHECPICGLLHGRPLTNAERQAAYRQRMRAGGALE